MENWQAKYISDNMSKLSQSTICASTVATRLMYKRIINGDEFQYISTMRGIDGNLFAANHLYALMTTKSNGYNELIQIFRETQETAAFQILMSGLSQLGPDFVESVDDLHKLLNLKLSIFGKKKTLQETLPTLTLIEASAIFRCSEMRLEFLNLTEQPNNTLVLGEILKSNGPKYVPRFISNCVILDPKAFTTNTTDTFVFKCPDRCKLQALLSTDVIAQSKTQLRSVKSKLIYLEEYDDWYTLAEKSSSPIHLVRMEESLFFLERSTSVTDTLKIFNMCKEKGPETYISEDDLIDKYINKTNDRGMVICDSPGMGKTWLIKSLAHNLQLKNNNSLVFIVQLSDFSEDIGQLPTHQQDKPALHTLLEYSCKSKLALFFLMHYVKQHNPKIYFLFDGFDEILPKYLEKTKLFLRNLSVKNRNEVEIIVSCRPHMRSDLETLLGLVSYDILPFDYMEQKEILISHWKQGFTGLSTELLGIFANRCIQEAKQLKENARHDILGIPLQCYLLAVCNENKLQYLRGNHKKVPEDLSITSVCDMYEKYVENALQKILNGLPDGSCTTDWKNDILTYHTWASLSLLFPEVGAAFSTKMISMNNKSLADFEQRVEQLGVIKLHGSRVKFIHRSFAEYFAGKYFCEFWTNCRGIDSLVTKFVGIQFFQCISQTGFNEPKYKESKRYTSKFSKIQSQTLVNRRILWFMNNILKTGRCRGYNSSSLKAPSILTTTTHLEQCFQSRLKNSEGQLDSIQDLKSVIQSCMYGMLICCVQEALVEVLSLLQHMIKVFIGDMEPSELLHAPREYINDANESWSESTHKEMSTAFLLIHTAATGSSRAAAELFGLFSQSKTNYLLDFCMNWPVEYLSPMEHAIAQNNMDMVKFFFDKSRVKKENLLITCVVGEHFNEADLDARIEIIKYIMTKDPNYFNKINTRTLSSCITLRAETEIYNIHLLKYCLKVFTPSFDDVLHDCSVTLLRLAIQEYRDDELLQLVLLLFGKRNTNPDTCSVMIDDSSIGSAPDEIPLIPHVFSNIDWFEAASCFAKLDCNYLKVFKRIHSLQTLKLLTHICEDFSKHNNYNCNYLHYAVQKGRTDWVEYLIQKGHDVNQRDKFGYTPLLCLSIDQPLQITRLLLENGADINIQTSTGNSNVAHILLKKYTLYSQQDLKDWSMYLFEMGCGHLFDQRDDFGETPLDELSNLYELSAEDQMTSLLEAYSRSTTKFSHRRNLKIQCSIV